MSWWHRQPALEWTAVKGGATRRLVAPVTHQQLLAPMRRTEVGGRVVERLGLHTAVDAPPATPSLGLMVTELPQPLLPLLVTDDFFLPASKYTTSLPVDVWVPPERSAYDGRRWRVLAADAAMARALLDDELWAWLDDVARHGPPVAFFVEGTVLGAPWPDTGRDLVATRLAGFADHVADRLQDGRLDPWIADVTALAPQQRTASPRRVPGTSWELQTPERAVLFYVWNLWPGANPWAMVRDSIDGVEFVALEELVGASTKGVVMLPLAHEVPDHVHYARGRLGGRSNVSTEWLDFDDDFHVHAHDPRIGLEVTTPRLMEYLYDHKVHRMDVKGPWLLARVKRFDRGHITEMVRTLAGARELLPRHQVG